jgi:hypothetical protein
MPLHMQVAQWLKDIPYNDLYQMSSPCSGTLCRVYKAHCALWSSTGCLEARHGYTLTYFITVYSVFMRTHRQCVTVNSHVVVVGYGRKGQSSQL